MPCCSAFGCTNSTKKGFALYRFPTDPERRKKWLINMKRDKWIPTENSRVCEVHFAPEMWEKPREDGRKKLRQTAVPTLFSFSKPSKRTKASNKKS